MTPRRIRWAVLAWLAIGGAAHAQEVTYRGFVDTRALLFPEDAANDTVNAVVDLLARQEIFVEPVSWLQLAAGIEARLNSHDQVDRSWRLDIDDRGLLRPALSVRRLNATITRGRLTVDLGKQFLRWGKTDIVTPTDRFAPRDFLNVFENEYLAVRGARAVVQAESDALEVVWVPYFTPSRTPLLDERWTVPPAAGVALRDAGSTIPGRGQAGIRWAHTGALFEHALSYFDGFNNLPDFDVVPGPSPADVFLRRRYARLRSFGADAAVPTRWLTLKMEASYFTTPEPATDEYVLYVLQAERQTGEWLLLGGYAGQVVTADRPGLGFAPDRGFSGSIVGRASYTIDTNRSLAVEGAVRENGGGVYAKGEYSQARGQHWRATVTGVLVRGEPDDFLGQFRRNSHVTFGIRFSF